MVVANERISGDAVPGVANCEFAIAWGTAIGLLMATVTLALLADRQIGLPSALSFCVAWLGLSLASAISLYVFAVSTAAV
jgi:hypothetical protein